MKRIALVAFVVTISFTFGLLAPHASAQTTGAIVGSILDEGGRPLVGAEVSVAGLTTNTDAQGRFRLTGVPSGTHTIVASYLSALADAKAVTASMFSRRMPSLIAIVWLTSAMSRGASARPSR